MKKMFVSALILSSFVVHAGELATFSAVTEAIAQGKQLFFIINFKECTSQKPLGDALFSVTPNAVAVIGSNRITASDRHFTLDDPIGRGTPMYDYSKFNIDSEGAASIKMTVMNAINYEKMASYTINCELSKGFKVVVQS